MSEGEAEGQRLMVVQLNSKRGGTLVHAMSPEDAVELAHNILSQFEGAEPAGEVAH